MSDQAQLLKDLERLNKLNRLIVQQQSGPFIILVLYYIAGTLISGGLFYWFSTSEARYESPDCESLRFYSYIFALVSLATALFQVLILLVACCTPQGFIDVLDIWTLLNKIYGYISFFLFIFIYVALFKNEPCGDLRILAMICFILSLVSLFLYCCMCISAVLNK